MIAGAMLLASGCGSGLPDASPLPPVLAEPTLDASGTFEVLFGDGWAIALVTACTQRRSWIDGLDSSELPCRDPDQVGPHFVLVDSAGHFVRRYEAEWVGSSVPGCYTPSTPWTTDTYGFIQFGPEGKIECPDD